VIVHPEFRGKGAGSFLLETMKTRALKEYRAQELKLICHNTNTRALLFYHRQGFKPFDLKPMEDFRGNRIAGIQMSIRLETKEQPNA
jgi:ribosomal protein S18 acetylase RimI-like enzyme